MRSERFFLKKKTPQTARPSSHECPRRCHFCGEKFWGRLEAIRQLSKELSDEENYISEDESEKEDCHEFTDSDKDENAEL
ncbi:hypothetical protein NPIL_114421 [Nephila pilipes]|uniref:Uncharacterized protein n=1 Tax=Nephila pilipes TaxID=299642 RepID=A0A8X6PQS1_NEPPI|nr:hypothetical protein NPIL_114421 [Nephila pilipes]